MSTKATLAALLAATVDCWMLSIMAASSGDETATTALFWAGVGFGVLLVWKAARA